MSRPLPQWLHQLSEAATDVLPQQLSRFLPPESGGRQSAVLVAFGEGSDGPDLLLIERAGTLREHAGQPAFPGGAADPGDADLVATALREAVEEVGLDESGIEVFAVLPGLWLPPSGFVVVPVLGWWHTPSAVFPVDSGEVAAVARVPLSELVDPAARSRVRHPSGYVGPAFTVQGMVVWGFTAGLVDRLLALGGWERPWDRERWTELPAGALGVATR